MKYIDADRLLKEVKRLEKAAYRSALGCADSETRKFYEGKDYAYQHIVGILIDSLRQNQQEVDLEKEIDKEWKKCNPVDEGMGVESAYMHIEAFDMIARHFAKWGAEQFAKIVRANLSEIGKDAQSQFEQLYFEITGTKMYGGYND